jgi:hypothetical protein
MKILVFFARKIQNQRNLGFYGKKSTFDENLVFFSRKNQIRRNLGFIERCFEKRQSLV